MSKENKFDFLTESIVIDVMRCDEYFLRRNKDKASKYKKQWLENLYTTNVSIPENENADILFFRSLERDDYKKLFHEIISTCNSDSILIVEDYVKKPLLNVDSISFLTENSKLLSLFNSYDIEFRLALFIRFIRYLYIVDKLYSNNFNTIVLFSDMQPIECLASHIGNEKGKGTVTLQHGLYVEYTDVETVNVVNYEVQPSKKFLAWGENTKKLIKKYHKNTEVVVCGKPDIHCLDLSKKGNNKILVVFDQECFRSSNILLLRLISDFCSVNSYTFEVRYHPHNNKPSYRKLCKIEEQSELYECYDFIVGISSSLIYELKAQGARVFQFVSDTPTVAFPKVLRFRTSLELLRVSKSNLKTDFNVISKIGHDSLKAYSDFFSSIVGTSIERPFFSIVIPTYNSATLINRALSSIEVQTCKDYEVIISDGMSDDYTYEYLSIQYSNDPRFKIYSSPDNGIYDGMNKAFSKVRGKWLIFLGSDDQLYNEHVLSNVRRFISEHQHSNHKLFYGNVVVSGDVKWARDGSLYDGEFSLAKIKQKNICHQAIFYDVDAKAELMPYNTKYKLCSDWDMNLKFFANYSAKYMDETVSVFNAGGMSTEGRDEAFGKDFKSNIQEYFGSI